MLKTAARTNVGPWLATLGAALLSGCLEVRPGSPSLRSVEPAQGPDDAETAIAIRGGDFWERVVTDFADSRGSRIDATFQARLGSRELNLVQRVDAQVLTALVPAGLAPDLYDLAVVDPYGREVTLQGAYRVLATGVPSALAFVSLPVTVEAGACSGALTVQTQDALGRPAPLAAPASLNLTSTQPALQFFSDAACSQPAASVPIAAGGLSATFHFRSSVAGAVEVTVVALGLRNATQNETVLPAAAAALAFATPARTITLGACSPVLTIEVRDALGNAAPAPSTMAVTLAANPSGDVIFYSDPLCGSPAATGSISAGASTLDRYAQGLATGAITLIANTGGLNPASQVLTVNGAGGGTGGGTGGGAGGGTGGGAPNTPPLARLSVTPGAVDPGASATLDASGSTDAEDAQAALQVRFDFENDGVWDTSFSTTKTAAHVFPSAGLVTVAVEVRDSGGLSAYATNAVLVRASSAGIVVTTAVDENNAGATPSAPGGTGLSLREAIAFANGQAGHDVISFQGPMTIAPTSGLPAVSDSAGTSIVGQPGVVIDGAGAGSNITGLRLAGAGSTVLNVELKNFSGTGILLDSSGGQAAFSYVHHGGGVGIEATGAGATVGPGNEVAYQGNFGVQLAAQVTVVGNDLHHNSYGIACFGGSTGSKALGNRIWANTTRGLFIAINLTNFTIWHNTIDGQTGGSGVLLSNGNTGHDIRNNVFSNNSRYGIEGPASGVAVLDYNDSYGNNLGVCSACTPGAGSKANDPLFRSRGAGDFRLLPASTLINAGTPVSYDVNGPAPGTFNGSAPDMGALESP